MSGRMSRNKGATAERELAQLIYDELGIKLVRNLDQTRSGGSDLVGLDGWSIEAKRHEILGINKWWKQTADQAFFENNKPVLIYRQSRKPWMCVVDGNDMNQDAFPYRNEHLLTMSLPAWCQIVRKEMN
jgi:Holliday junction resolvase